MEGMGARLRPMLPGTLLLALLVPAPAAAPSKDDRAVCLKACAGAPKEAKGAVLLECLRSCEPTDAGVR